MFLQRWIRDFVRICIKYVLDLLQISWLLWWFSDSSSARQFIHFSEYKVAVVGNLTPAFDYGGLKDKWFWFRDCFYQPLQLYDISCSSTTPA